MTVPGVCKQGKSDKTEVFYKVKMAFHKDSEGNALLEING